MAGALDAGVQEARSIIFADGTRPAGLDPARIHAWFHDGPGTGGYSAASDNLRSLADAFPDYGTHLKAAQQALAAGWHGTAVGNAVRSFDPLALAADALTTHAQQADNAVADQITSFTDTRNRVVSVAASPPTGPGANQFVNPLSPDNVTADAAVAAYQIGTHNNQDAYSGYQGQTSPQSRRLPQQGATSSASESRKSSQDNGTSSTSTTRTSSNGTTQGPSSSTNQGRSGPQQHANGTAPTDAQQPQASTSSSPTPSTNSSDTGTPTMSPTTQSTADYQSPLTTTASSSAWSPTGTVGTGTGTSAGFGGGGGGFGETSGFGGAAGPGTPAVAGPVGAGPRSGVAATGPAASRTGRAGTAGGPGMSGGGGSRRDDDKEYRGLGILKQDWATDLIGELPPTTAAVIEANDDDDED